MATIQALSRHVHSLRILRIQSPLAWRLDEIVGPPTYSDKVFLHKTFSLLPDMHRVQEISYVWRGRHFDSLLNLKQSDGGSGTHS